MLPVQVSMCPGCWMSFPGFGLVLCLVLLVVFGFAFVWDIQFFPYFSCSPTARDQLTDHATSLIHNRYKKTLRCVLERSYLKDREAFQTSKMRVAKGFQVLTRRRRNFVTS